VEQIAARLDDRFRLLTGGGRTALPRQQTLRATLDWSYGLLADAERVLFRRRAVFAGGWTLEAAEAVCANVTLSGSFGQVSTRWGSSEESLLDTVDVLDLLCRLVDKSLVEAEPRGGESRYRMLETIRAYAFEKLAEAGEVEALRGQHYRNYLALAESADRRPLSESAWWLDRLEVEHDNLRAALGWILDRDQSEPALALCVALSGFWTNRGHWTESRAWFGRAIAASRRAQASRHVSEAHRAAYGTLLDEYGFAVTLYGDYATARGLLEEALAVKRELGDKAGVASVLTSLGTLAWYQDDAGAAEAFWEEGLAIYRELGDRSNIGWDLSSLALLAKERGDYAESERLSLESLAHYREPNMKGDPAWVLQNLGWLAMIAGDYAASQAFAEESLTLRQEVDHTFGLAWSLTQRGYLAWHRGEFPAARAALNQGLALFKQMEASSFNTCPCVTGLAAVDVSEGHLARGVSLLGAVAAESERTGRYNKDIFLRVYDQARAAARAQMDPAAFDRAWAAGRALTMVQAMEIAPQA
jgi:non-specific serine/threonine protein kinase